ncbi:MAG: hypothetical protein IJV75_01075 [Alphaproteobacteria bacterium]|nr:hypothetical protein [Alphaproteobacteria bacterium]
MLENRVCGKRLGLFSHLALFADIRPMRMSTLYFGCVVQPPQTWVF